MRSDNQEIFDFELPSDPVKIEKRKLVFSEGIDDQIFFNLLFRHLNLVDIQSEQYKGKASFRAKLNVLKNTPGFNNVKSLLITRDADEDHGNSFESIRDALEFCGLEIPPKPGTFTSGKTKIGIFIFPGSGKDGCLEDLCLEAVNQRPEFSCVESYFHCLQDFNVQPKHLSKAKSRVFVASIDGEIAHLGRACERKCWSFDAPAFEPLIAFIRQL